jgi:ribosome-associated protein
MFITITYGPWEINSGNQMKSSLMLIVTSRLQIPMREFTFTYARSGGPGGQNVNKVNTKATLHWPMRASDSLPDAVRARFLARYAGKLTTDGDLLITSQRYRDAGRNMSDCLEKLRYMLHTVAEAPKSRRPTKPTKASVRRRLDQKRRQSGRKTQRRTAESEEG